MTAKYKLDQKKDFLRRSERKKMIYSVIKTIQNDVNNDDFICMCKKSYRKTCLVCLIIIAATILFGLAAYLFHDYNKAFDFFIFLFGICSLPGCIALMLLFGNVNGGGIVTERMNCHSMKEWVVFAERQVINPKAVILSKRIEVEQKEIYEVCTEGKELRCKNVETGAVEILELKKTICGAIYNQKRFLSSGWRNDY